jgi:uncharacterized protein HemX
MADDTDVLEEIKDSLVSLEGKAETAKESKDNGGLWGWIVALIVGAVVSIGAALLIWKLNKKNEELAKLRTQIEQDEVRSARLQHQLAVAGHQERIDDLAAEAAKVRTRVVRGRVQLYEETMRHDAALARVEAARDWNQLDALNRENR